MDSRRTAGSFVKHAATADVAVIEGNRGLHDGRDARGTHSTAALATLIKSPVVLIHPARKATRTAAAVIVGCCAFDQSVTVAGVVLNEVAGERHQKVITESLTLAGGPPVIGVIPRLDDTSLLPGRHLGLVTPEEHPDADRVLDRAADVVAEHVDVDRIFQLAHSAPPLPSDALSLMPQAVGMACTRIGYFRDAAFTFYYAENLEALRCAGAKLVEISPLSAAELPDDLDGLYIGGGFPETNAAKLAENSTLRSSVRGAAQAGLPIYAECGGLVYLAQSLVVDETTYPMAGVFPIQVALEDKPQGHGYSRLIVDRENPFFGAGTIINAHEFHYTRIFSGGERVQTACAVEFGSGSYAKRDGLIKGRTMATYFHIHALGTPDWAPAFVLQAKQYRAGAGCGVCCGAAAS
jgi:cobyrinic acid a,c-diamide synthase